MAMLTSSMRRWAPIATVLFLVYVLMLNCRRSSSALAGDQSPDVDVARREILSPYNCALNKHFCDLDSTRCTASLAGGYTCECRDGYARGGSLTTCEHAGAPANNKPATAAVESRPKPAATVAASKPSKKKSWVVAIPLVYQTSCTDTNLEASRVKRLNDRRASMMKQLEKFQLDAMPAEFCRQEALEDERPLCKGTPLSARIDNATKTLNLAKNLRNAFLTCKNSGYNLCLIMEDDTVLHPDFHVEAKKTLAAVKESGFEMGLIHLCPQMLHRTVHPEKGDPVWTPPPNYDFMPVADPIFSSQRCKNLNCSCNKKGCPCEMASKYERFFWRPPDRVWQYTTDRFPCVTYFGGPQAYLVTPEEAGVIADGALLGCIAGGLLDRTTWSFRALGLTRIETTTSQENLSCATTLVG
eukprot:CAMPEP_0182920292 /NCGR_PEP_ID=MMETSP0105_2-20130417/3353_1 /TAXON_ID=81532 ORGANISM="Acanthoeca-like sp., Strain 10tr" /NCGR_SAMPLE_ID=MMETSP0105_2 /ASSEMBLY_ACC=CAM_ASM_000205 /LENGTH=412 /DNA_ID=CAMNT_0025057663 /DNA_START=332 /DNA_END=1571 /DNA_ORIENTATION=-